VTLLLALCLTANAFDVLTTPDGHVLSWEQVPITYRVANDSIPDRLKGATAAVDRAFDEWTIYQEQSPAFANIGTTQTNTADASDDNAVFFEQGWPWGSDVLALAVTWTAPTGEIAGFDLRINGSPEIPWSLNGAPGTYDLQATLTHEAGHVLGLSHSDVAAATMSPSLNMGRTTKRSLHSDDRAGADHLYPAAPIEHAPTLGCAHLSTSAYLLSSVWLPALLVRRRRR